MINQRQLKLALVVFGLSYEVLGKCFAFAGFCWRKNIGLLHVVTVSLNDTCQILKYQSHHLHKNSYSETDHPHMFATITWIGLMAYISGLGDTHRL